MPQKIRKHTYESLPSYETTQKLDMLSALLDSAIIEMKEFTKKKPDESLNPTKIKILNRLLIPLKDILSADPSGAFLDLLDEDVMPSNSDCVLILGQYQAAINQFKEKYYGWDGSDRRWFTKENPGSKLEI
jgi:hypothetical protein